MAEKEESSGPGLAGAIVAAILSVLIGGLLAAANLLILPVSVVKELPPEEERVPKALYYVSGLDKGGNTWKQKMALLERGQSGALLVSEGELNRWAKSSFKPDPKKAEEGGFLSKISLKPEFPNFRIVEDQLQVSTQVSIPILGEGKKFLYQGKGRFVNQSFKVESGYIGSCPIPNFAGLPNMVYKHVASTLFDSEEGVKLGEIWAQVNDVSIENNQVKLVRQ